MRNMLFLSHANPEDNEFTQWLALQLAREGYPVWCDLTKLLGGEDFWKDAEQAIRERTTKFLYVLSRTSNVKNGPLQELQVAQNVARLHGFKEFIIPLHIDDLPHAEINIQLSRIMAIPFYKGWAGGLSILLEKLERNNVKKNKNFSPESVASWWRSNYSTDRGVLHQEEDHLSNWFPIQDLPSNIHFHKLKRSSIGLLEIPGDLPYPAYQFGQYVATFAGKEAFESKLGCDLYISDTNTFSYKKFLEGKIQGFRIQRQEARNMVSYLFRAGWENFVRFHQLPMYELSSGAKVFYFTKGLIEDDRLYFTGMDGKETYRNIIGYKTMSSSGNDDGRRRFWHFGIQSKPIIYPFPAYIIKPHILFSDDGSMVWDNKDRLHRARRSQCKNWWNAEWRDRILATISWLSRNDGTIKITLADDTYIRVSNVPLSFQSPVSFTDPEKEEPMFEEIPDEDEELLDFEGYENSDGFD